MTVALQTLAILGIYVGIGLIVAWASLWGRHHRACRLESDK